VSPFRRQDSQRREAHDVPIEQTTKIQADHRTVMQRTVRYGSPAVPSLKMFAIDGQTDLSRFG